MIQESDSLHVTFKGSPQVQVSLVTLPTMVLYQLFVDSSGSGSQRFTTSLSVFLYPVSDMLVPWLRYPPKRLLISGTVVVMALDHMLKLLASLSTRGAKVSLI